MAIRGVKPKPAAYLALVKGQVTDGAEDPALTVEPEFDNGLEPPSRLSGRQLQLWNSIIRRAAWLTDFDIPRAFMWVHMHTEFEKSPRKMVAGRIAQLRALGSELGLDPSSRARLGADVGKKAAKKDPAEQFFD